MGFWKKKRNEGVEGSAPAPEPLRERVEDLERALRSLKSEWLDTLDRLQRLHARIVKRARVDDGEEATTSAPPPASSSPPANGLWDEVAVRRSRGVSPARRG